ncbi:formylglycine-generating enzyme family protein [Polaribacter cellanae]|uniref:Formylglycine-generating enzyme family protein n=1 Tax=Polaribacter cellanae TaxID=2818493 RepID=A0A975CNR5_9FLAO|nr:formylglycine-generating enzyme family protein [Polaribacter cellanae]QTE22600.1 formylglycine-generating enzyme family protein [Polaribacter cellanae]
MTFKTKFTIISFFTCGSFIISCDKKEKVKNLDKSEKVTKTVLKEDVKTPDEMVWVERKTFLMGAKEDDQYAMMREKPAHKVSVDGFFIDVHEVTNRQFRAFVEATKYVTTAEKPIDWDEIKKDLPARTKKPADSILQPGSLIFNKHARKVVSMNNYQQWWIWKIGANWKQPEGPGSSIEGKDNYPVVHVSYNDALAYCKWANRRLPTEAEWESAAQGKNTADTFTWGNNFAELNANANTWQGQFPTKNNSLDGFEYIAPVESYPPNSIGLYDMAGNVWEMTTDLFNVNYYKSLNSNEVLNNPRGADSSYTPSNPYQLEHVMKGGSFLCHASYCASFRISAKMGMEPSSSADHIGFRTVATPEMLVDKK